MSAMVAFPFAPGESSGQSHVEPFHLLANVVQEFQGKFSPVEMLSIDGLYKFAYRFLVNRESFIAAGKPGQVRIGFHYTSHKNLDSIRRAGLIRNPEKRRHRAFFGDGIYLANNCHAFLHLGNTGLVVIYVQGTTEQLTKQSPNCLSTADTLLGNKLTRRHAVQTEIPRSPYFDEIVVRNNCQILPLFAYPREAINNAELFFELQCKLQAFVDHTWEQNPTVVRRTVPASEDLHYEHKLRCTRMAFWLSSKQSPKKRTTEKVHCKGPSGSETKASKLYSMQQSYSSEQVECPICISKTYDFVRLKKCQHAFHKACITKSLKTSNKCPLCRVLLGTPFGKCPAGTMTILYDDSEYCNGVKGLYTIQYDIPSGIQSSCHDSPGTSFQGASRTAYVPGDGNGLVQRLKYAFQCGLTFTVGMSLTSGHKNVVTWASVHHKTSLAGGPHGFPDDGYYLNCHEELDALGVPKAEDL